MEKPTCKDTRKLARERNDPHDPHNEADAREEVVSRTRMSCAFWRVCCVETLLFLKFLFNFGKSTPMSGYQMLGHKLSVKDANYPKSLELDN